jgi:twitching motility protein PilT
MRFLDGRLVVAMAEPTNHLALGELKAATGRDVIPAAAYRADLQAAIERSYPGGNRNNPFNIPTVAGIAAAQSAAAADSDRPLPPGVGTIAADDFPMVEAPQAEAPPPPVDEEELKDPNLAQFLNTVVDRGASDLHLTSGLPPMVRINGELTPIEGYRMLLPKDLQLIIYSMLTQKQREVFEDRLELDLSYSLPGRGRFRVNVFQQRDSMGAVMRLIPFEIRSIDDLGVPPSVKEFANLRRGMVLVTGITGSGKSTTLAALIDLINAHRAEHIMTVEDPIEFLHKHKRSIVNQREVGTDTHGFAEALRHVLRQDPDVILVGELRDLETISTALTAAETGHLVFATLHTQDAPQSVDRIIDVFPPHAQEQIRIQLAGTLAGVVSQQLLPKADRQGRVVACEVLVATDGIRNLIREGKTHQIYSSMQAGGKFGMQVMDQHLAELVKNGAVSYDIALERCHHNEEFNRLVGKA